MQSVDENLQSEVTTIYRLGIHMEELGLSHRNDAYVPEVSALALSSCPTDIGMQRRRGDLSKTSAKDSSNIDPSQSSQQRSLSNEQRNDELDRINKELQLHLLKFKSQKYLQKQSVDLDSFRLPTRHE